MFPHDDAAEENAQASRIPLTIALYTPCPISAKRLITETKALNNAKLSNFIFKVSERLRRDLWSFVSLNHNPFLLEDTTVLLTNLLIELGDRSGCA
ncbi:MAG: hypothetical protein QXX17_00390 [Conexivisphaerales archaeon]